ncbi:hypothetical protein L5515_001244 [Caenorhabditis briggsae]|uniref:Uncharacterized protein n=1 Tax=Caenorhabditis briggsae TaxID=6238 RepID=A0AAE9J3S4_CAEBR|nr:hypothetical protein L5515_001244 [Caenorhabditis briggsae]
MSFIDEWNRANRTKNEKPLQASKSQNVPERGVKSGKGRDQSGLSTSGQTLGRSSPKHLTYEVLEVAWSWDKSCPELGKKLPTFTEKVHCVWRYSGTSVVVKD